ncbi:hypothetical protein GCM10008014_24290 [Paenibacillus silvae]|uniref:NERD domain-containing protein n=1 Tax=Paenibacillus silvae TaxID=1325358 RepID=A0ABQ1ZDC7_9BACL|nr:nuclease-related domain-containing protein [Paenibacillus silvae]GGH55034.1 hypothetical protein GCM10008014_24290 [Paenibacillus silvae]
MDELFRKYSFLLDETNGINDDFQNIKNNSNLYEDAEEDVELIENYLITMLKKFSQVDMLAKIEMLRIAGLKGMIEEKIKIYQFHVDYITSFALKVGGMDSGATELINEDGILKIVKLTTLLIMFKSHDLHKKNIKSKHFNNQYQFIRLREFSENKINVLRELICYFDDKNKKTSASTEVLQFIIRLAEKISDNIESISSKYFDANYSYHLFSFSFKRLKDLYIKSISDEQFSEILELFTFKWGDFNDVEISEIILYDRMEEKFLIKLSDNSYFIPNIYNALDKITDIIERVIFSIEGDKLKFEESKGTFLEEKINEIFLKSFPNSRVLRNSQWNKDTLDGENDLTVLYENFAFVVEAKSNGIRKNIKKGILKEINSAYQDIVLKTNDQAKNFSSILKENIGKKIEFKVIGGGINILDLTEITEVIPIGVIFADIPVHLMKDLNPQNNISVPILSLFELIKIMQCLTLTSEKIDYLRKRYLIDSANTSYHGDEYDLLYTYLMCGFNTDQRLYKSAEKDEKVFIHYIEGDVSRDYLKRVNWFGNLLIELEQKKPQNWLSISLEICNIPYVAQKQIERELSIRGKIELLDNMKFRKRVVVVKYAESMNDRERIRIELDVYEIKRTAVHSGLEIESIFYLVINTKFEYKFSGIFKF